MDAEAPISGGWPVPRLASMVRLLVCTRCRLSEVSEPGARRAGSMLLAHIEASIVDRRVSVQPVACMSACRRACVVGLMAPGHVSYLFGDLAPTEETGVACADLASRYAASAHGHVPRGERPPPLREGILARLPPLVWANGTEITWPA